MQVGETILFADLTTCCPVPVLERSFHSCSKDIQAPAAKSLPTQSKAPNKVLQLSRSLH